MADIVQGLRLNSIAEWRWATLGRVCRSIEGVLESLTSNFEPSWSSGNRDAKRASLVAAALTSVAWRSQFRVVSWITKWVDDILAWVGGCKCHDHLLKAGRAVMCDNKGRRLGEAYIFGMQALREGLAAANDEWTADEFGGDNVLWAQAQGAVGSMFLMGARRLDFLNALP